MTDNKKAAGDGDPQALENLCLPVGPLAVFLGGAAWLMLSNLLKQQCKLMA